MPGAGSLRKRVTFQSEVAVADEGGGAEHSWSDTLTVWGELRIERGRERLAGGRLESALGGLVIVRSSEAARAITPAHRVLIDGDAYQIRSIANEDSRNRFLTMVVEKGVAT